MDPTKTGGEHRCSGRIESSISTCGTHCGKRSVMFVNIQGINIASVYCLWFFVSSVKLNRLNCWSRLCLHSLLFSVCLYSQIVDRQSHMPWACYVNLFLSDLLNVDNLSQGITRQVPLVLPLNCLRLQSNWVQ